MAATNDRKQSNERPASVQANDQIEHSRGGKTTRDALDLGVPMAPGPDHDGPEDALAENTRGDYSGRLGDANYNPHTTVRDEDGSVRIVSQRKAATDA